MTQDNEKVLNKQLYRRLKATFGHVKIRNKGEAQSRKSFTNLVTGKKQVKIVNAGEYYLVCCPFCNDTRFRCWINHRYGSNDEFGRAQCFLATCFNGGCDLNMKKPEAYQKLQDMLMGHSLFDLRKAEIAPGVESDNEKVRSNWPGVVTRIDQLDSDHKACQYLRERKFDPNKIGKRYNVHWCSESPFFICRERLIIPIYIDDKMVGWQARPAFDLDNWKTVSFPKYYTASGTPRKSLLYNFKRASKRRTGVITEGVTDVWRLGDSAMCTLGSTMTDKQQQLFEAAFKDYSGVLLFDPDIKARIREKADEIVARLNCSLKSGFCSVDLPKDKDPGSMPRAELRAYIETEAAKKGVKVDWSKR